MYCLPVHERKLCFDPRKPNLFINLTRQLVFFILFMKKNLKVPNTSRLSVTMSLQMDHVIATLASMAESVAARTQRMTSRANVLLDMMHASAN